MTVSMRAAVVLEVDGVTYQPGEWITLPDRQQARAAQLVAYGYADEMATDTGQAPVAAPVKARRKRAAAPAS